MILKIFRSADAFLYLPTYIAEEFEIFKTLLKKHNIDDVIFPPPFEGSDIKAIEDMLLANSMKDEIAIAIADPTAIFDLSKNKLKNCRVIGAIINKLPFWAVNHLKKDYQLDTLQNLKDDFDTVIHYNSSFITGYALGKRVQNEAEMENVCVPFGEEIPLLINQYETANKRSIAITADIVSLVKGLNRPVNPLSINYNFSKEGDYLTTGIITSVNCCDDHPAVLEKIIEGIQKAILYITSSEKIAEDVCFQIAKKPQFIRKDEVFTANDVKQIVNIIRTEEFYPADLNISLQGWLTAVRIFHKANMRDITEESLLNSFDLYINNKFVISSEKSLAKQLGINLDTFNEEVREIIFPFERKLELFEARYGLIKKWVFPIALFLSRIPDFVYVMKKYWLRTLTAGLTSLTAYLLYYLLVIKTGEKLKGTDIFLAVIPIVLAIGLTLFTKFSTNAKTNSSIK